MRALHRYRQLCAALVLGVASSLAGMAGTLTINTGPYSNGNGLGGGEYTGTSATLSNASYSALAIGGMGGIETYCLEFSEHFSPGGTYNFTMGTAATNGSGGAVNGADPISNATAWLYSEFALGTLAGYDYTSVGRQASNSALQLAFWFFEDETPLISGYSSYGVGSGNLFINAAIARFGNLASAKADSNGAFGVYVLNLTSGTNDSVSNQSQLYFSTPNAPTVPDSGGTIALLVPALFLLAASRRCFGGR
jgi:hypothetical protein